MDPVYFFNCHSSNLAWFQRFNPVNQYRVCIHPGWSSVWEFLWILCEEIHYTEMKASAVGVFVVGWLVNFEILQPTFPSYPQCSCATHVALLCPETKQTRSLR